ncbi:ATP-binding protein [Methylocystis hirsuta]|uniref:ATP-binding protein n=1 Tax=Methylocystis hirsuta TaxID=369798 RepID=A0A3M9XP42_9HYPH|nr:ATP-binding protein [Methylocystis hirsuta]RNJ49426.1 ATP-binding protein [Methylocystis hirsuta]
MTTIFAKNILASRHATTGARIAIMTVGAPGSGKTTYARGLDPTEWITVCLDDIRAALFGDKKVYFKHLEANPWMRQMVHRVNRGMLRTALRAGKNVILPNTHTNHASFQDVLQILDKHEIDPKIVVFDVPWDVLVAREERRSAADTVGLPFLRDSYTQQWATNAWWRRMSNVEVIKQSVEVEPC